MERCCGQAAMVHADHVNSWWGVEILIPLLNHTKYFYFCVNPCVNRCQHGGSGPASELQRNKYSSLLCKMLKLDNSGPLLAPKIKKVGSSVMGPHVPPTYFKFYTKITKST
jgi:hypothetical protein